MSSALLLSPPSATGVAGAATVSVCGAGVGVLVAHLQNALFVEQAGVASVHVLDSVSLLAASVPVDWIEVRPAEHSHPIPCADHVDHVGEHQRPSVVHWVPAVVAPQEIAHHVEPKLRPWLRASRYEAFRVGACIGRLCV